MAEKKFYWLKLQRDFFKRHDVRIIEEMENGKDYLLFYLKLLVESLDHEGHLRFSDTVPYNDKMLAVVTNTNVDIVRSALKVFSQLNMIEILEDETIFMTEVEKMIGSETEWAEKKRIYRENQRLLEERTSQGQKKTMSDKSKSIEIDKEKDKELEINKEHIDAPTEKETKHTFGEYKHVRLKDSEYTKLCNEYGDIETNKAIQFLDEYIEMKGYKAKNHNLCIRKWVFDAVKERDQKKNIPEQNRGNRFLNA